MVDFRRWITALAVLALFVGLAGAQVPGGGSANGSLICSATVAVPPALRAEGMTEVIGDILISCSGGGALAAGSTIPTANVTVSLGTNVTSRLLGIGGVSNASEALLIIDEAGASVAKGGTLVPLVPGFGPDAPQTLCSTPQVGAGIGGCAEFANTVNGYPVAVSVAGGTTPAANVFSGLASGNQVTFEGIPILAPVSASTQRTFRITNVRANVRFGRRRPGGHHAVAGFDLDQRQHLGADQQPGADRRLHSGRSDHRVAQHQQHWQPVERRRRLQPVQRLELTEWRCNSAIHGELRHRVQDPRTTDGRI